MKYPTYFNLHIESPRSTQLKLIHELKPSHSNWQEPMYQTFTTNARPETSAALTCWNTTLAFKNASFKAIQSELS